MDKPLRILLLEDNPLEAELRQARLSRDGLEYTLHRVDTREQFGQALDEKEFDIILADYSLPAFDGLSALEMAREKYSLLPFIMVSGTLGEELAIETLRRGCTDYILKQRMERLGPAVRRALQE